MTKNIQGTTQHTSFDLSRRRFVGTVWASGLAVLAGCGGGGGASPATNTQATTTPGNSVSLSLLAGGLGGSGPSCVDANGNVYVVDTQAKSLRKITVTGSAPGVVSTLFTNFPSDGDVVVDAAGNFYGARDRAIIKVAPSGLQQVLAGQPGGLGFADGLGNAASFARPRGMMLDSAGNLYVADEPDVTHLTLGSDQYTYGGTLRIVTPAGMVSTVVGTPGRTAVGGVYGYGGVLPQAEDASYFAGYVHLADGGNGVIWVASAYGIRRLGGDVGAPVWIVQNRYVQQRTCASDGAGGLWLADGTEIRKMLPNGTSSVVVGVDDAINSGVGSLDPFGFVVGAGPKLLYFGSENAVIRVQLN